MTGLARNAWTAANKQGFVAEVQRHARETHGMALSHDEALLLAFRAELDATTRAAAPLNPTARREKEEE